MPVGAGVDGHWRCRGLYVIAQALPSGRAAMALTGWRGNAHDRGWPVWHGRRGAAGVIWICVDLRGRNCLNGLF